MKKVIYPILAVIFIFSISYSVTYGQNEATSSTENEESEVKETNSIRDKVQEKIENVKNNPKAYFGTITDIVDTTIQIKGENSEISQISVDENETTFVNITKTATEVGFEDCAIGDYLIAMGYTNGNNVLEGKRILISSPLKAPTRKVIFGTVSNIEKKTVTFEVSGEEIALEFPKQWKGPEISELEEGSKVIVVYEPDKEGELFVRTIEIVSSPEPSPTPEEELEE